MCVLSSRLYIAVAFQSAVVDPIQQKLVVLPDIYSCSIKKVVVFDWLDLCDDRCGAIETDWVWILAAGVGLEDWRDCGEDRPEKCS